MANAQTVTTLAAVHEGIVSAIREQFPQPQNGRSVPKNRESLPTPACLIELTEMEAEGWTRPPGQAAGRECPL